eukprot:Pompholyxophrys_punicea_v1_NODE_2_length_10808_cov_35.677950.p12 type:complete len:115 gc:universal NODE_2_length_10808_cov_35.677950:8636-8980(+)
MLCSNLRFLGPWFPSLNRSLICLGSIDESSETSSGLDGISFTRFVPSETSPGLDGISFTRFMPFSSSFLSPVTFPTVMKWGVPVLLKLALSLMHEFFPECLAINFFITVAIFLQ